MTFNQPCLYPTAITQIRIFKKNLKKKSQMWALCLIKKYLKILPRFRGKSSSLVHSRLDMLKAHF